MSDILFKLLNEDTEDGSDSDCLFNRFKNRLFKDYAHGKRFIKKNDLWMPLNEITKELYGAKLDREGFNNIYSGLDQNGKGFITKKQFGAVAKCLIMSLITYFERKYPIPGREISLCLEESDLPVQMEIVDTLSEDEIKKLKNGKKSHQNNQKKAQKGRKNKNKNKNVDDDILPNSSISQCDNSENNDNNNINNNKQTKKKSSKISKINNSKDISINIENKSKQVDDLLIDIDSEDC